MQSFFRMGFFIVEFYRDFCAKAMEFCQKTCYNEK